MDNIAENEKDRTPIDQTEEDDNMDLTLALELEVTSNSGADSFPNEVLRELDEFVVQETIRGARQPQVGDILSTRSKANKLATSTCPRDILNRMKNRLVTLKDDLLKREINVRATGKAQQEFEKVFEKVNKGFQNDFLLLDGKLAALLAGDTQSQELAEMIDAVNKAIEGTQCSNLTEFRARYDEICDEIVTREEKEKEMQEQIDSLGKALTENGEEVVNDELSELVTDALHTLGCGNLVQVVDETLALRKSRAVCSQLIGDIMNVLQIPKVDSIIGAIQEINGNRDQLIAKIKELESKIAELADDRNKLQQERDKAHLENDQYRKREMAVDAKARRAKNTRISLESAIVESSTERDLAGARAYRDSKPIIDLRITIDESNPLHPDYACGLCGKRKLGAYFPADSKGTHLVSLNFGTLRELGALYDMKDDWNTLSVWEAREKMMECAESKSVSSNALKMVYRKALCEHAVSEVDKAESGLLIVGEDRVSEALSDLIAKKSAKLARKNCVVLIPGDSCILKANGPFREIDHLSYADEPELRRHLQEMETADGFPRSIVIILKSLFTTSNLTAIRKNVQEIVKKVETTVYIAADLLPSKPNDSESDSIKDLQAWLTKWRLEKPVENLIVISPISGVLWRHHPFSTLFVLMRKESKDAFEAAIKFLVDGIAIPVRFTLESSNAERITAQAKRSQGAGRGGKRGLQPSSSDPCHYCHETGHFKWDCPNKRRPAVE